MNNLISNLVVVTFYALLILGSVRLAAADPSPWARAVGVCLLAYVVLMAFVAGTPGGTRGK